MNRLLLIACCCCALQMNAQVKSFSVATDKERIVIGEQFHLEIKVVLPLKEKVEWIRVDSIPHFEIEERSKPDSLEQGNDMLIQQSITLTSWDSGSWHIPPFSFRGKSSASIPVTVSFSPFDPKQDYHDIKDVFDVKKPARVTWYWYILMAMLLLVIMILVFPGTKKDKTTTKPEVKINPHAYKTAIDSLKELDKERSEIRPKVFYTRLKDILRIYLQTRKNIDSFTATSAVLVQKISELNITGSSVEAAKRTFENADLAKFANYESAPGEMDESLEAIKIIITEIENKN
jgi:hypothetical protein